MDVEAALSGRAGDRGVRRLLLDDGRATLREVLATLLGGRAVVRTCRLQRAHLKPGRKLTACYDVTLDDGAPPAPVGVIWSPGGTAMDAAELDAGDRDLRSSGVPRRFERLWGSHPSSGMLVLAAPLDPTFPGLGRLSDPRRAAEALAECGVVAGAGTVEVHPVRYRPGQRHVLEYRAGGRSLFVKLYRPGAGGPVAEAVTTLAGLLDAADVPGLRAIRPAAVLCDGDAILYHRASGTPLSEPLRVGRPAAPGHLQHVGRLLRVIHESTPGPAARLGLRDLDGEVRVVLRTSQAMAALRPDLGAVAAGIVEKARARLEALDQEPPTVIHGDMKADHLLWGRDGLTVLDTDRCALGDPAFDLGKMLADLCWWSACGRGTDTATAEAEMLAAYGGAGPRMARARLYAALLLVRTAARRVPLGSRDWASRTAGLLALAGRAVEVRTAA